MHSRTPNTTIYMEKTFFYPLFWPSMWHYFAFFCAWWVYMIFFLRSSWSLLGERFGWYLGRNLFPADQNWPGRRYILTLPPPQNFFYYRPPGTIYRPLNIVRRFQKMASKNHFPKIFNVCLMCATQKIKIVSDYTSSIIKHPTIRVACSEK